MDDLIHLYLCECIGSTCSIFPVILISMFTINISEHDMLLVSLLLSGADPGFLKGGG